MILKLFFIFLTHSYALDNSLPEFECTIIEKISIDDVKRLFGDKRNPTFSLRKNGIKWQFLLKSKNLELSEKMVIKNFDSIFDFTSYQIILNENKIFLELKGKSPSRNGLVFEVNEPLLKADKKKIARVTCH